MEILSQSMVFETMYNNLGISIWLILVITIWEGIWTALAMWRAAKRRDVWWFIVFFVINLFGIPEIIYLILTRKNKSRKH